MLAARKFRPQFFYLYLPHLDYAAQKEGPDSAAARQATADLDRVIGSLVDGMADAYPAHCLQWMAASEYVVTNVDHVCYPNRLLRQTGLLAVQRHADHEQLDVATSTAWALVDHQFSHVFVRDADRDTVRRVAELFRDTPGIAEVLVGPLRRKYALDHLRSGEVILVSEPNSWQAYYWWTDDAVAPPYARTVDIHRKPGYDPVEFAFRRRDQKHSARRHVGTGFPRCAGNRSRAAGCAVGLPGRFTGTWVRCATSKWPLESCATSAKADRCVFYGCHDRWTQWPRAVGSKVAASQDDRCSVCRIVSRVAASTD